MAAINVHVYNIDTLADIESALVEVNAVVQAYDPEPVPVEFQSMFGNTDATGTVALTIPTEGVYYQLYISATSYAIVIETIVGANGGTWHVGLRAINYLGGTGTGTVKGTAFVLKASEDTRIHGGTVYRYDGATPIPAFIIGTATIYGLDNGYCKQVYLNTSGVFTFDDVPAGNSAGPYRVRLDIAGRTCAPSGLPLPYSRLIRDLTDLFTETTNGFCMYVRTVPGAGVIGGAPVDESILSPTSGPKPVPDGSLSISGTVMDTQGAAIPGTRVSLNNGTTSQFIASGTAYSFEDLGKGGYIVTPAMTGYTFFPKDRVVILDARNQTGINFVGYRDSEIGDLTARTGSISGQVLDRDGNGIADVTFMLNETAITPTSYVPATSPDYIISGLTGDLVDGVYAATAYMLRITKPGWAFSPLFRSAGIPTVGDEGVTTWDHTNFDFYGVPDLTIAIKIYNATARDAAQYKANNVNHMNPTTHSLNADDIDVGIQISSVDPPLYLLRETVSNGDYSTENFEGGICYYIDGDGFYYVNTYLPVIFDDNYRLVDWFDDIFDATGGVRYDPREAGTVTFTLFVERTYAVSIPVQDEESAAAPNIAIKLAPTADPPEYPAPEIPPTTERPDSTETDGTGGAEVYTDAAGTAIVMAADGGYTVGGGATIIGIEDVRS